VRERVAPATCRAPEAPGDPFGPIRRALGLPFQNQPGPDPVLVGLEFGAHTAAESGQRPGQVVLCIGGVAIRTVSFGVDGDGPPVPRGRA